MCFYHFGLKSVSYDHTADGGPSTFSYLVPPPPFIPDNFPSLERFQALGTEILYTVHAVVNASLILFHGVE
jgi:hypothetical protein